MKRLIIAAAIIGALTGCRIVSYTTNIEGVNNSTITSETVQEQTAPKTVGDIAPKTSLTPGQ
jgi:hypothetical protein